MSVFPPMPTPQRPAAPPFEIRYERAQHEGHTAGPVSGRYDLGTYERPRRIETGTELDQLLTDLAAVLDEANAKMEYRRVFLPQAGVDAFYPVGCEIPAVAGLEPTTYPTPKGIPRSAPLLCTATAQTPATIVRDAFGDITDTTPERMDVAIAVVCL